MTNSDQDGGSPNRQARRLVIPLVILGVIGVLMAAGFLAVRPDLPPTSDIATVSQMVAAGGVDRLALRGSTLTIHDRSAGDLRVEAVTPSEWQGLLAAAKRQSPWPDISQSGSSGQGLGSSVGFFIVALVLPLGLVLLLGIVFLRLVAGPPNPATRA